MLPTSVGVEPVTSWSPIGRVSNWATEDGSICILILAMLNKLRCQTHFQFSASQITWYRLLIQIYIQLTLVISTPLISILSLMSNWFLSPDYFPYVFIVFQLRVCRTTFMSTLRLSRPSFSVPEYIFHRFYNRVSRTRTMMKEKNVRCGAAGLSVNDNHNRPLINKSII